MRWIFLGISLFCSLLASAQAKEPVVSLNGPLYTNTVDSLIKDTLVKMTMAYPMVSESQGLVDVEKYSLKRAKASWFDMIVLQGNVNEFVINQSPNATFWPKYNVGLNMPLGLFGRNSADVNMAKARINVANAKKDVELRTLRKEVLTRYEVYKEKRLLLELQQAIAVDQNDKYKIIQKQYSNDKIELAKVNEGYQDYLREVSKVRSLEKDLQIAELQLEELIGTEVDPVINAVVKKYQR